MDSFFGARQRISAAQMLGVFLLFLQMAVGQNPNNDYLAGGTEPFSPEQKAILNKHADLLQLGINYDWMTLSRLKIDPYVQAIDVVAKAVKSGTIPGAMLFADRFQQNTMPAMIGYKMTDPQKHFLNLDTKYSMYDLTGPLLTVPLMQEALLAGDVELSDQLDDLVPFFHDTDKARITVKMLLRHSSGLPADVPRERKTFATREEMLQSLADLPLAHDPGETVEKSPLNFLLLGLVLEEARAMPFSQIAARGFNARFAHGTATLEIVSDDRKNVAPGAYDEWLGRMEWGDPIDPYDAFLGADSPHTGLIASADEVAEPVKKLMALATFMVDWQDPATTDTFSLMFQGDPQVEGGAAMGLGYELGRFGPKSFGWDSPHGHGIWVLPEQIGFIIYLSNTDHPRPRRGKEEVRAEVLPLLAKALGWPRSLIDTAGENPEPSSSRESEPSPSESTAP